MAPFRIKLCGITTPRAAREAVAAGADAVGLNFYPPSVRYVSPSAAEELRPLLERVLCVGVFVNAELETLVSLATQLALDAVQLHGDEPPEYLARCRELLPGKLVLRALRPKSPADLERLSDALARHTAPGSGPDAVLVDAFHPAEYGGTGGAVDANVLAAAARLPMPWILAGGLTPENVRELIRQHRPGGVDVASGVEAPRGCKSAELMRRFVSEARRGFGELEKGRDALP